MFPRFVMIMNWIHGQLSVDLIDKLSEHSTGIAEVRVQIPFCGISTRCFRKDQAETQLFCLPWATSWVQFVRVGSVEQKTG